MNKRIKELIEQATIRGEAYLPGDNGHPTATEYFDKEKFAELIVNDCLSIIERRKNWIDNEDESYNYQWIYGYEKAIGHCSMFIKEFYGVQEQTESQKMAAAGYTRRPRGWTKEGTE